ncbi:hypothetical protein DL93DRAFT_600507 [Clavulina sp. PMI_390]|nr:hypothetical protein DL93DRAFT_600507 [Clavulina sp. PMI_390]
MSSSRPRPRTSDPAKELFGPTSKRKDVKRLSVPVTPTRKPGVDVPSPFTAISKLRVPAAHPTAVLDFPLSKPPTTPRKLGPVPGPPVTPISRATPQLPSRSAEKIAKPEITPSSRLINLDRSLTPLKVKPFLPPTKPVTQLPTPDLASIRAHQHASSVNPELARGLELSPTKRDRSGRNGQGLIRNGLAERADSLFQKTNMEHSMWRTEMLHYGPITSQPAATLSKTQKRNRSAIETPHVKFRVMEICETTLPRGKEMGGHVVAKCAILSARSRPTKPARTSAIPRPNFSLSSDDEGEDDDEIKAAATPPQTASSISPLSAGDIGFVLFALPAYTSGRPAGRNICGREGIVEGAEVHVWEPWHEIIVPVISPDQDPAPSDENSEPTGDVGKRVEITVLMCTKFATIPSAS